VLICVSGGGATRSLKAFTLAEVLITLAIIGVVAALTIPSVVTNYKNQETATRLKKAFTTIANTTNLAIADNGPISTWDVGAAASGADVERFVNKYLIPYLRITKNCGVSKNKGCWYEEEGAPYWLKGGTIGLSADNCAKFILSDGTFVVSIITARNNNKSKRVEFYIDTNGLQKPNRIGKDIFVLTYALLSDGKVVGKLSTVGSGNLKDNITVDTYGCNLEGRGSYCSALIYSSGWHIPSRKEYNEIVGNDSYSSKYPW